MPERAEFFISAVSSEFKDLRAHIARDLQRPGLRLEYEETFRENSDVILPRLNDYIASCDAVIHIVGAQPGATASIKSRSAMLTHLPDFSDKLGLDAAIIEALTYTQWEAWLALYHGKKIFIAAPDTYPTAWAETQVAHLNRLRALEKRFFVTYATPDRLSVMLLQYLHNLLPSTGAPFNLRPSRGKSFEGRMEVLADIREKFRDASSRIRVDAPCVVISGLGGIGKTQLAVEFGHLFAGDFSALLLISASTPEEFQSSFANLAVTLKLPEAHDSSIESRHRAVLRWLDDEAHRHWLLLIDNVDTKEVRSAAIALQEQLHRGHVLMTGRLQQWPDHYDEVKPEVLEREHAVAYLLDTTAKRRVRESGNVDEAEANVLAKTLGDLPLALVQAAASINARRITFSDYLQDWNTKRSQLLDDRDFDPKISGYPRTVAITWLASYDELPPESQYLLSLICWFAPEPIPEGIITRAPWPEGALRAAPRNARAALEADPNRALKALYDYSFATPPASAEDGRCFSVHRLVQEVGRIRQRQAKVGETVRAAALHLLAAEFDRFVSNAGLKLNTLPEQRRTAPHALAALEFDVPSGTNLIANQLQSVLYNLRDLEGQWKLAEAHAALAVAEARAALQYTDAVRKDAANDALVNSLCHHAVALTRLGHLNSALEKASEAVSVSPVLQGSQDNMDALRTSGFSEMTLGSIYLSQGNYVAALICLEESRGILESLCAIEPENRALRRQLGVVLCEMSRVHSSQGNLVAALTCIEECRGIFELLCTFHLENHPFRRELGSMLNFLGNVHDLQGNPVAAMTCYERSRSIFDSLCAFEPENRALRRELAITLDNMGNFYKSQGNLVTALACFEECRDIAKSLCELEPENHARRNELGIVLRHLGGIYQSQDNLVAALNCFEDCRGIYKSLCTFEPENRAFRRELVSTLNDAGHIYKSQGNLVTALACFEECRDIAKSLCELEPENLAHLYQLVTALDSACDVYDAQGNLVATRTSLVECRGIRLALCQLEPDNHAYRRNLAYGLHYEFHVRNALNERGTSLSNLTEAAALLDDSFRGVEAIDNLQSSLEAVMNLLHGL